MPTRFETSPKRAAKVDRAGGRASPPASRRAAKIVPLRPIAGALMAATPLAWDETTGTVTLRAGGAERTARLAPSVSPIVVQTAVARGEFVVIVEDGDWVVVGALRTSATPGVDRGEDYVIEAQRIELRADHRAAIVVGAAQIVVDAIDRVEVLAQDITSRARRVHKLVGRILNLN